jgi:hypothetical protein
MSETPKAPTVFDATNPAEIRRLVEIINNYGGQPDGPAELPDPEVQSPAQSQADTEKKDRADVYQTSLDRLGSAIFGMVPLHQQITTWEQLADSPPPRMYTVNTQHGKLFYGMHASCVDIHQLLHHIRHNLKCKTCVANAKMATIMGPEGSMYLKWLNQNPIADLPAFPFQMVESTHPEVISADTFGPERYCSLSGKNIREWTHLTVRPDVVTNPNTVAKYRQRSGALDSVRTFVDQLLKIPRHKLDRILAVLDENSHPDTNTAAHLNQWADSVYWVRLILAKYDDLCHRHGDWPTLPNGIRCALYLVALMDTPCIVEPSNVVLPVKKTAENFLDFLPALLDKSEADLIRGANGRMNTRFDSLAGTVLAKMALSETNTITLTWLARVDLDLHLLMKAGSASKHIYHGNKKDIWAKMNLDDGVSGSIGHAVPDIGAEIITVHLGEVPAGATMEVLVGLFSGRGTYPFEVDIRMGNVHQHSSHTWKGEGCYSDLSRMVKVYSGPVHMPQPPVELVYPKALQQDVKLYGAEWVKAIGTQPRVQVANLASFKGLVVKCPPDLRSYVNHSAVPLTMVELLASVSNENKAKGILKLDTLSQALEHGVQIVPTNFNPVVLTQISTTQDIFKDVYTKISTSPGTLNPRKTDDFVATVAGVYIHGKPHSVLPGKNHREEESKSCLDATWGAYPDHPTAAGLIMKSAVTHVVPHRGGALLLLSDSCHFPVDGEMSANCFPELLKSEWHKCRRLCDYVNHTVVPVDTGGTPMIGAWAGDRVCVWVQGKKYEVVNDLMLQ